MNQIEVHKQIDEMLDPANYKEVATITTPGHKVLFLDVDGVLNSQETFFRTKNERDSLFLIDPYMALLVGRILEATGAQIVLSSSWRHHPDGIAVVERRVAKILDTTPSLPRPSGTGAEYYERGKEIEAWLEKNEWVEKYAILDDDSDFMPEQPLFKTSWQTGLTDEIAATVIQYLNS